jgi:hypothetical protein
VLDSPNYLPISSRLELLSRYPGLQKWLSESPAVQPYVDRSTRKLLQDSLMSEAQKDPVRNRILDAIGNPRPDALNLLKHLHLAWAFEASADDIRLVVIGSLSAQPEFARVFPAQPGWRWEWQGLDLSLRLGCIFQHGCFAGLISYHKQEEVCVCPAVGSPLCNRSQQVLDEDLV